MKYKIWLTTREWELVAEIFDFDKFYNGEYDDMPRYVTREAWQGNIPLFLHDIDMFDVKYILEKIENLVTPEPIFSIFEKQNLTFREMIQEIWTRRKEIVRNPAGEENPYDDT